ncbi:Gfo/Idh/MocA family oxidoreductase [Roseomonas sp. PWR1]|uniref:Gfo/Idh/MocA family oxidoreductase n=1 Tax=Roseomonas nitratireducens TaxID=2820810 RepID=A0ABS4AS40_9PROT|nr:Gfo/Idh/MocA family oxidoreductase [Neoroseomonas nitratireducens]MBP0464107.1 Gfo/Idh/MocA family oxidoreductase [Neoroseomonas nitratireducens]
MSVRILLLGCGAFGRVHLRALARLGAAAEVRAFDPDAAMRGAVASEFADLRFAESVEAGLAWCDAAIIATPVPTHAALAEAVLRADRHLFLEKPAVETAREAEALARLAGTRGRIAQVGLYFRFHPKALALRALVAEGAFGPLHYLAARFSGLKRARGDSGALLNDAVHFADLLPWIAGAPVTQVFAQLADPLGRGREDLALVQLRFADGAIGLIEAGCVLPGRWPDAVVPGAETRKEVIVAGRDALAEVDFAAETFALRRGRHAPGPGGAWLPGHAARDASEPPAADPVAVVAAELAAFIDAVATRRAPEAGLASGAVAPARILDAARRSAQEGRMVELEEIA